MAEQRTIDVTGLPGPVVADIELFVSRFRTNDPTATALATSGLKGEQWAAAWRECVESHRDITAVADDSRESIYEGR